MAATQAHLRGNAKHQTEKLTRITIQPYKDEAQKIKSAASLAGLSVTQYILKAVRKQMEIDENGNG